MTQNTGVLYIVATPIGNLKDISLRAIDVLKQVDYIAAEDTRHSSSLLQQFNITTPLISLHEFNERQKVDHLLARINQGQSIALISDAGTPLISDPGFIFVREAKAAGIKVVPIPGACAAIAALSVSGLPTDKFIFEGFLPAKAQARAERLKELVHETRTLIFYEAPHRLLDALEAMKEVFGDERQVIIARELTKVYETIQADTLDKLVEWVKQDSNQQRGEIVVLVKGAETVELQSDAMKILELLVNELPLKKAVEITAKLTQEKRNVLYDMALTIKKKV